MEKQAFALVKAIKDFRIYILYSHVIAYVPNVVFKDILTQDGIEVLAEVKIADGRELFYRFVPQIVKRFLKVSGKDLVRTAFLGKPTAFLMIEMAEVSKDLINGVLEDIFLYNRNEIRNFWCHKYMSIK